MDLTQVQTELADRLARSVRDLLAEKVLEFEVDLLHVDVPQDLANHSLKLKFRMNGITYLKSKAGKAVVDGDRCRVDLDVAGAAVFEGGSSLDFELCKVGCWGPSTTLARCRVPLKQAVHSLAVGSNQACVWNLTLWATGAPGKALGSLAVEVCAKMMKLKVAGGFRALKALAVPLPPTVVSRCSAAGLTEVERECAAFVGRAAKTQWHLREALGALRGAALAEHGPKVAPPQHAEESPDAAHEVRPELPAALKGTRPARRHPG